MAKCAYRGEALTAEASNESTNLTEECKRSKVSASSVPTIAFAVRSVGTEQTASQKEKALRLFCRAMIRLYLQDNTEKPQNGKRLGVL